MCDFIANSQSLKLLQVLNFASIQIKSFKSSSVRVENTLNMDKLLKANQVDKVQIRPEYDSLKTEILTTRAKSQPWANVQDNQYPDIPTDHYIYLGMVYVRNTDRIMLRPWPLFLKSKLKG